MGAAAAERNQIRRGVARLWAATPALAEPRERRSAELLAGMLLLVIAMGAISGTVQLALVPGFLPTALAIGGALGVLVVAYRVARTTHYRVAAWLAAVAPVVACVAVAVNDPADPGWFAFMLLGPMFAALFLGTRATALVAAACVASIVALAIGVPALRETRVVLPALMLHLFVAPLMILWMRHRASVEEERRAREQQRDARLAQAHRLEALGRMTGGVAHDFNNLLAVIGMSAGTLPRTAHQDGAVNDILSAVDRSTDLVADLLAYAREQPRGPTRLDVGATVRRLEPLLRRLTGDGVRLRVECEDCTPAVSADLIHLEQVLLNLVTNSRAAVDDRGDISIEVRCQRKNDKPYVRLSVTDTGRGMPPEVRERVLEPFFTTRPEGTGIGLDTVNRYVTEWGGRIEIDSTVGHGTRVDVYVPAAASS